MTVNTMNYAPTVSSNFNSCPERLCEGMGQTIVSDPDPHKDMPPGSGSAWTDVDPDPGVKKAWKICRFIR